MVSCAGASANGGRGGSSSLPRRHSFATTFATTAAPSAPSAQPISGVKNSGIATSQSEARPDRARLDRRDDLLGKARRETRAEARPCRPASPAARPAPAEQAALGAHQRRAHILAEALAQHRPQFAEPVDQAIAERRL